MIILKHTLLISAFFIFTVINAYALSENDLRINDKDLASIGYTSSKERFAVSIQAYNLYSMVDDKSMSTLIKAPKKKFHVSAVRGTDKSTIYYYEYANHNDAGMARSFITQFIWGSDKRSKDHPERIYNLDNYIIVISSPEINHLDNLFTRKLEITPPSDALIRTLLERLQSPSNGFDSPRGALSAFLEQRIIPVRETGPCFGESWEIDAQGNVTKQFYEFIELRRNGEAFNGVWTPITPDNNDEKAQVLSHLKAGKSGNKAELSENLQSFINSMFSKQPDPVTVKNERYSFIIHKGNVACFRRVGNGIVLLVTTEHWLGTPQPFVIAYFWHK